MDDATFTYRLTIGLFVLALFLLWDVFRHGRESPRLKEYGFISCVTVLAMLYGLAHDGLTYYLSPEYFEIAKGLPPGYWPHVVTMALKATWSVGLVCSAVLVFANNPTRDGQRASYSFLFAMALFVLAMSIACEVVLGLAFHAFSPAVVKAMAWERVLDEIWGPSFVLVAGMHYGAYIGGLLGLVLAVYLVRRRKMGTLPFSR